MDMKKPVLKPIIQMKGDTTFVYYPMQFYSSYTPEQLFRPFLVGIENYLSNTDYRKNR